MFAAVDLPSRMSYYHSPVLHVKGMCDLNTTVCLSTPSVLHVTPVFGSTLVYLCVQTNHFPGSWGLGRKDRLCRNLSRMRREFGDHYNISAVTHILPADRAKLLRDIEEDPLVCCFAFTC